MKQKYYWDTGALILFFGDHDKAKSVMIEIDSDVAKGYINHLVLSEFYYKIQEVFGNKIAEYRLLILKESKNNIVDIEFDDINKIGNLKMKYRKLSMVDCIVAVISNRLRATIVRYDR